MADVAKGRLWEARQLLASEKREAHSRRMTMTLLEILQGNQLRDDVTIYAQRPWTTSSEVILVNPPPELTSAIRREYRDFDYFLEAFIARDFLEDLTSLGGGAAMSGSERCLRLIQYADNDA